MVELQAEFQDDIIESSSPFLSLMRTWTYRTSEGPPGGPPHGSLNESAKIPSSSREGVIIECSLKRLFKDARDVIITSQTDVRGFPSDNDDDQMLIFSLK